jgi:hypothetical protein
MRVRNYLLSAGALLPRRSGRALVAGAPHFLVAPWHLHLVALVAGAPKKSRLLSQPAVILIIYVSFDM